MLKSLLTFLKHKHYSDVQRLYTIKKTLLETAYLLQLGHIPSSLSALEILYVLYNKITNITKNNAGAKHRDRVIISKEHCRLAQICILTENGLLDKKYLDSFCVNGGRLGHDIYGIVSKEPIQAIDISIGSLGHGLSVGIGLALGGDDVYVLLGDGECQEGSIWEAIIFAGHHKLNNLTIIIDKNDIQIECYTRDMLNMENIGERIKTFNLDVFECNGHNINELENILRIKTNKAKCIIANTIKGRELLFWCKELGFSLYHWSPLGKKEFQLALGNIK
jgi:transketolase